MNVQMSSPISCKFNSIGNATAVKEIFPNHDNVKNCIFKSDEEDEAALMHYAAQVGAKNGYYVC